MNRIQLSFQNLFKKCYLIIIIIVVKSIIKKPFIPHLDHLDSLFPVVNLIAQIYQKYTKCSTIISLLFFADSHLKFKIQL